MTVEQRRCEIAKAYEGQDWKNKCAHMDPRQVCAIYARLSTSGRLEQAERERRERRMAPKQLSMFDLDYGRIE